MRTGLHLHVDVIGAGLGKVGHVTLRLHDHQMHVQWLCGHGAQRLHHQRSNRDVWYKTTIHHIHMDPVGTGLIHRPYVIPKLGKVS